MSELSLADRFRRLHPAARAEILDRIQATPGALADLRYDWPGWWAHPWQIVTLDDLLANPIVLFTGERGAGKTRSALQLFWWLIQEGHVRQPRIFAKTEADVEKVIVGARKTHSKAKDLAEPSGLLACIPPEERPEWISDEGPAGVVRCRNGIEIVCFVAVDPEQCVSHEGDCDLVDDIAKWGPHAHRAWFHQQASLRKGMALTIGASTRRGMDVLRTLLGTGPQGPIPGVLVKRPPGVDFNRFNLAANLRGRVASVAGGDLARQDMDDEDMSPASPFGGLPWEKIHVPAVRPEEIRRVVVAVDPAEGKGGDHDEWGIGYAVERNDRTYVALEDASGSYDDAEAGEAILALCERRGCSTIVAETNRGPRVLSVIRAAHLARELRRLRTDPSAKPCPMPEVIGVVAREGKVIRAGPVRTLYLDGLLRHGPGLEKLEKQMREWNPDGPRRPRVDDRIDWLVHALTHLAPIAGKDAGPTEQDAADQCLAAAEMNAALSARARGVVPEPKLTPVAGAPPGDARYAGPPAAVGRLPNWRARPVF